MVEKGQILSTMSKYGDSYTYCVEREIKWVFCYYHHEFATCLVLLYYNKNCITIQ
jgi:hypothetical protein